MYGLGVAKRSDANAAYQACGGTSCPMESPGAIKTNALDADANTKETVGAIALITGGALAAGGAALFALTLKSQQVQQTGVRPWIGPGSVGVRGSF
jgi:hypothetical protein